MNLGRLIEILRAFPDQDKVLPIAFNNPDSSRGSYDEIAFSPAKNVPVKLLLMQAEDCIGATFTGYKGGEYTMNEGTKINLDNSGVWSDDACIWNMLLNLMLNQ